MNKKIKTALDKIFHDSAISELRMLNKGTSHENLTYNDILYLSIIEAHSGEYTASKIADMLFVSRPAVTQKINELEKNGYIYKIQSKTDKRVFKLFINKEGKSKMHYEITDKIDENIAEKMSSQYSTEQIDLFCEMTNNICDIMLKASDRGAK